MGRDLRALPSSCDSGGAALLPGRPLGWVAVRAEQLFVEWRKDGVDDDGVHLAEGPQLFHVLVAEAPEFCFGGQLWQ